MNREELEIFLWQQIPLSKMMGLHIESASDEKILLKAPLNLNRNHLGSAFGGSLQSMLIFSCYTWLFKFLHPQGACHVLIQEAHTEYIFPVEEDILVECQKPSLDELEKFMHTYRRRGRARLKLKATVRTQKGIACSFNGEFVAEKN